MVDLLTAQEKTLCNHNDTLVIKACCNASDRSSSGYIECGCGGVDEVVCENPNCTGFTDDDGEELVTDCWG